MDGAGARRRWLRRQGYLVAAADLLLGAGCPGCRSASWGICGRCARAASAYGGYLTRPEPCPAGFPVTATTSPYDALMKELVSAHKEHQVRSLTPFLAGRLAAAVALLVETQQLNVHAPLVLVPVPSSPAAIRRRGVDATWELARRAARLCARHWPVTACRVLGMNRRVSDQAGLTAVARGANLAGSLRSIRALPTGVGVVLVDDVVTTGASLTEAARALSTSGVLVVGAATVAATVRERPARVPTGAPNSRGSQP